MKIQKQIDEYIGSQPDAKRSDMEDLHRLLLGVLPGCRLWFLDGKDSKGKIVSNPNVGYGFQTLKYADGSTKDFYQVGMSANTTGFSIYLLGLGDKTYLSKTYGSKLGKASVTGYCIKFKKLKDIDLSVLEEAVRYGVETSNKSDARL